MMTIEMASLAILSAVIWIILGRKMGSNKILKNADLTRDGLVKALCIATIFLAFSGYFVIGKTDEGQVSYTESEVDSEDSVTSFNYGSCGSGFKYFCFAITKIFRS